MSEPLEIDRPPFPRLRWVPRDYWEGETSLEAWSEFTVGTATSPQQAGHVSLIVQSPDPQARAGPSPVLVWD